jgi:NAD(P)-dependent dehydrogenase (short-subunit alcohol dehydrogenase family)
MPDPDGPVLDGQVALITGAASGQGRAAAVRFARHGADIVIADLDGAGGAETAALVEAEGRGALALVVDVSDRGQVDGMVAATIERFGRLDVLYNNAAVQMSGSLLECTEDEWDRTIATNLDTIFWACRAALPHLRADGGGRIINTASVLGLIGSEGYCAYGAAKAGLVALTRQIAVEHGPSVRANVIAPGSIDTPRFRRVQEAMDDGAGFQQGLLRHIPAKRLGTAEDVAAVALFLATDASAYLSGAVVPCDGGLAALR